MKLLRRSNKSDMLDIYECPFCGDPEYYGMLHWKDSKQHCRRCIYQIWSKEEYNAAKQREIIRAATSNQAPDLENLKFWRPSENDKIFPIYEDGVNYADKEDYYV
jgi:hypothetical protein